MSATALHDITPATAALIADLKRYCLPGGEAAGRDVRGIRTTQRGAIRSGPQAKWNPFEAEESVDATRAGFRWEARIGSGLFNVVVTDAYADGHGVLTLTKGPLQLKKLVGPEVDKGELQRYLGYLGYCPPILLNNPALDLTAVGERTLRVRDRLDRTGAFVDLDVAADGQPTRVRAVRPMTVGKRVIPTAWSATGGGPREREGLRVWHRMEAAWHLPECSFTYIWIEVTSLIILR